MTARLRSRRWLLSIGRVALRRSNRGQRDTSQQVASPITLHGHRRPRLHRAVVRIQQRAAPGKMLWLRRLAATIATPVRYTARKCLIRTRSLLRSPVLARDRRVDEVDTQRPKPRERAVLVRARHAAEADKASQLAREQHLRPSACRQRRAVARPGDAVKGSLFKIARFRFGDRCEADRVDNGFAWNESDYATQVAADRSRTCGRDRLAEWSRRSSHCPKYHQRPEGTEHRRADDRPGAPS